MNSKETQWEEMQRQLAQRLVLRDTIDPDAVKRVAGVDLAYFQRDGQEWGVCSIAVVDTASLEVVELHSVHGEVEVPYIPGFLSFRELPLVERAAALLASPPDLYFFDGNGYLHPRHMGLASHASFVVNRPTVGIAKTYYAVDGAAYAPPGEEAGAHSDIVAEGQVYGRALRTRAGVKPVFVSVGNGLSLDSCCSLALRLTGRQSRVPQPTRAADIETRRLRARLLEREK